MSTEYGVVELAVPSQKGQHDSVPSVARQGRRGHHRRRSELRKKTTATAPFECDCVLARTVLHLMILSPFTLPHEDWRSFLLDTDGDMDPNTTLPADSHSDQ